MEFGFGVVSCLRAAWLAALFPILMASLPFSCLTSVHGLVLGLAKRGKIMQASSNRFSVPQKFFGHFYVLAVAWTTVLLGATWAYAYTAAPMVSKPVHYSSIAGQLAGGSHVFAWLRTHSTTSPEFRHGVWRSVFLLLLMEVQALRRLYETIYVFNYSPSARMHVLGYLTGLFYYAAAPLSLCCNCAPEVYRFSLNTAAEFIVKGKSRMPALELDWWGLAVPLARLRWVQWVGAAVFLWGWVHQCRCHAILGSLRERREECDEYVIPRGDWFDIVSSPHYLAEIVLYAGILVASGGTDLTIWLLFLFVVANLGVAAGETHRWYLRKFEDYPRNRHAIIPFIY